MPECPETHGGVDGERIRDWATRRKTLGFLDAAGLAVIEDLICAIDEGRV